jgi:hypothetical protein
MPLFLLAPEFKQVNQECDKIPLILHAIPSYISLINVNGNRVSNTLPEEDFKLYATFTRGLRSPQVIRMKYPC